MSESANAAAQDAIDVAVGSARRLAALDSTSLLDTPIEEPYNRIARLAARTMGTPIATVTLIDRDRQFYKACVGIPEPLASTRETPLNYSFCKHTIALGTPLVIPDTHADARVADIPSVTQFNVRAYAGVPLIVSGEPVGTLCVMDLRPRSWSDADVGTLVDLAANVMTEIQLRMTITELEQMTEVANAARGRAERANRDKGYFLAMMSHDLRTPLNAIGGYSELLELEIPGPVTDKQREMLTRIRTAQRHLQDLITELLTFSKLEAGTETFILTRVAVDSLLDEVRDLVAPQLEKKALRFVYVPGNGEASAHADGAKMKRIVLNLLGNAIKFTPPGGEVTLSYATDDQSITVRVADTGIGIASDKIETIFDPFVRLDGESVRNPDGVGLGLAIGRRFAEGMGGTLCASSIAGAGSSFELRLPVSRGHP